MMTEELPRTNVLVHCIAGVSRSATIVMAYLMKSQGMTLQQAHRLVKSKRPIVNMIQSRYTPTLPLCSSCRSMRKISAPQFNPAKRAHGASSQLLPVGTVLQSLPHSALILSVIALQSPFRNPPARQDSFATVLSLLSTKLATTTSCGSR